MVVCFLRRKQTSKLIVIAQTDKTSTDPGEKGLLAKNCTAVAASQEKRREVEVLKNLVQRSQSEIAQRDDRPLNLHRATSTHSNVTANNTPFEHTSILW